MEVRSKRRQQSIEVCISVRAVRGRSRACRGKEKGRKARHVLRPAARRVVCAQRPYVRQVAEKCMLLLCYSSLLLLKEGVRRCSALLP